MSEFEHVPSDIEKDDNTPDSELEETQDEARELLDKHFAGMEIGDERPIGSEEMRRVLFEMHATYNEGKETNSGEFTGDTGTFQYQCEGPDCVVVRTA